MTREAQLCFDVHHPCAIKVYHHLVGLDGKTLEERVLVNPLDWWRMNAGLFPALSVIARRTLCIPATSAPSERLFSSAGSVVSPKRTKLDPHLAADMILLHEVKDLFRKL